MPGAGSVCPNLAGRYAIGEGYLETVFAAPARTAVPGVYWHTLQIDVEGSDLALQYFGEDGGGEIARWTNRLTPRCINGWLRRDMSPRAWPPPERVEGDERTIDRYLLISRDRAGNLLAQEITERYQTVSFWAPGGANVRVPFTGSTDRRWSRWMAAVVTPDGARPRHPMSDDNEPLMRQLGRLLPADAVVVSRRAEGDGWLVSIRLLDSAKLTGLQSQLLESPAFGAAQIVSTERGPAGAVIATLRIGPPPVTSAPDEARRAARQAEIDRTDALIARVLPLLPHGASVTNAQPLDGGYLIDVRCPDADALSVFVDNLRTSPRFGIPEVRRTEPYIRQQVSASVWVRER